MKKSLFILLVILLILPTISAVEIEMKGSLDMGETLLAKVSGNFIQQPTKQNIFLYRDHVRVPIAPNLAKINNEFYIHFQLLGKPSGNYSLRLENVEYIQAGETSDKIIRKNFTISDNLAQFTINSGFVITDKDFSIEVQNLQDSKITIEKKIKTQDEEGEDFFSSIFGTQIQGDSVDINPGQTKKINFNYDSFNSTFSEIQLSSGNSSYIIPILLLSKPETQEQILSEMRIDPSILSITLSTDSEALEIIHLYNIGNETIENITLSVSDSLKPYINLSLQEIDGIEGNSNLRIILSINSSDENKTIEGEIVARSKNLISRTLISLTFISGFIPTDDTSVFETCEEIEGAVCEQNQECTGQEVDTKTGSCCVTICQDVKLDPTQKIIGWLIVVAVVAFLAWFFLKKYRKTRRRPIDLVRIAKGAKRRKKQ